MRPALTLLMVAGGALLIRYAFLGRNPWDDVLAVIRGTPTATPNSNTGAGAGGTALVPTGGKQRIGGL